MDVSCHRPFLPGTSLEPAVIPTAQASSFTLQYFPYYVTAWLLLLLLLLLLLFWALQFTTVIGYNQFNTQQHFDSVVPPSSCGYQTADRHNVWPNRAVLQHNTTSAQQAVPFPWPAAVDSDDIAFPPKWQKLTAQRRTNVRRTETSNTPLWKPSKTRNVHIT